MAFSMAQKMPVGVTGRAMILMAPDVKKEIRITKDQDKQIQKAIKDLSDAAKGGGLSFDLTNPMAALDPALDSILNDDQKKRLDELFVQSNGGFALLDKKVAAPLQLTEEQLTKLTALSGQANSEAMNAFQHARSAGSFKAIQKKHDEFGLQMKGVLTPEQAAKFETMQGKPFKFKT